jgi:hypothetical protein
MPTGVVEDENDRSLAAGVRLARESGEQQRLEERLGHAVAQIPEGFPARRRHEGGDIKPIETMMSAQNWSGIGGKVWSGPPMPPSARTANITL